MAKTPSYQLRAIANYDKKMAQKKLRFDVEGDADLLEAINNDAQSLNSLVNKLLREHYKLNKK